MSLLYDDDESLIDYRRDGDYWRERIAEEAEALVDESALSDLRFEAAYDGLSGEEFAQFLHVLARLVREVPPSGRPLGMVNRIVLGDAQQLRELLLASASRVVADTYDRLPSGESKFFDES